MSISAVVVLLAGAPLLLVTGSFWLALPFFDHQGLLRSLISSSAVLSGGWLQLIPATACSSRPIDLILLFPYGCLVLLDNAGARRRPPEVRLSRDSPWAADVARSIVLGAL